MTIVKVGVRRSITITVTPELEAALAAWPTDRAASLSAAREAVDCPLAFCQAKPGTRCVSQLGYPMRPHTRRATRGEQALAAMREDGAL